MICLEEDALQRARAAFLETKPAVRVGAGKTRETTLRALNTEDDILKLVASASLNANIVE